MLIFSGLALLLSLAQAQTGRDLDKYIQLFSLKALPEAPPKNKALYDLGLRLFYDKNLSGKNNISCGSCHSLAGYSADTLPLGVGEGAQGLGEKREQLEGVILARHTPPLYNLGLPGVTSLFWDGRVGKDPYKGGWATPEPGLNGPYPTLKEIASTINSPLAMQALFPIATPEEMLGVGSTLSRVKAWEEAMDRLMKGRFQATYKKLFSKAYPGVTGFNIGHVANALAELETHHFLANNTLWDLYLRGNKNILSERMKRGAILFLGKASCINCHAGEHLTTFGFQNIGVPQIGPGVKNGDDKGRYEFTKSSDHLYRFKVPPLRNVALTAPYMHTGAFKTIWEVIDHYDMPTRSLGAFSWNPKNPRYKEDLNLETKHNSDRYHALAQNLQFVLDLTPDEKADLYCFLMVGLTDISKQTDLITKGVLDEISDCSPRPSL